MSWASKLARQYRVENGKGFRLKDCDPSDQGNLHSKKDSLELLRTGIARMAELQDKLFAQDRWAVLLIFQALDAAGKDGTIKHVMTGLNPQGCEVSSFKSPSNEELDHDYLWRCARRIPERGRIGIFNRSYYEEVLVVRVHSKLLHSQKIPAQLMTDDIWKQRYQDIHGFERYLGRNGVVIRKFFLHVSKEEQKKRFLERLDKPEKNWKFSAADVRERGHWDEYQKAYERMIRHTATKDAPWYVVPADHKWFTRIVVAAAVVETLEGLGLAYPTVRPQERKELQAARTVLEGEK